MTHAEKRHQVLRPGVLLLIASLIVRVALHPRSLRMAKSIFTLSHACIALLFLRDWTLLFVGLAIAALCLYLDPKSLTRRLRVLRFVVLLLLNFFVGEYITWVDLHSTLLKPSMPRYLGHGIALVICFSLLVLDKLVDELQRTYHRRELLPEDSLVLPIAADLPFRIETPSLVQFEVRADGGATEETEFVVQVVDSNNDPVVELTRRGTLAVCKKFICAPGEYYLVFSNTRKSKLPMRLLCSASITAKNRRGLDSYVDRGDELRFSALVREFFLPPVDHGTAPESLICPFAARAEKPPEAAPEYGSPEEAPGVQMAHSSVSPSHPSALEESLRNGDLAGC